MSLSTVNSGKGETVVPVAQRWCEASPALGLWRLHAKWEMEMVLLTDATGAWTPNLIKATVYDFHSQQPK